VSLTGRQHSAHRFNSQSLAKYLGEGTSQKETGRKPGLFSFCRGGRKDRARAKNRENNRDVLEFDREIV